MVEGILYTKLTKDDGLKDPWSYLYFPHEMVLIAYLIDYPVGTIKGFELITGENASRFGDKHFKDGIKGENTKKIEMPAPVLTELLESQQAIEHAKAVNSEKSATLISILEQLSRQK